MGVAGFLPPDAACVWQALAVLLLATDVNGAPSRPKYPHGPGRLGYDANESLGIAQRGVA